MNEAVVNKSASDQHRVAISSAGAAVAKESASSFAFHRQEQYRRWVTVRTYMYTTTLTLLLQYDRVVVVCAE